MRRVLLLAEDTGHVDVVSALVSRIAKELKVPVSVKAEIGDGSGIASMTNSILRELARDDKARPHLIVIAKDANCRGLSACRDTLSKMVEKAGGAPCKIVYCTPDPHVERWLLLDSAAFKSIFGRGITPPTYKCERDVYKQLLGQHLKESGYDAHISPTEVAPQIVDSMALTPGRGLDDSLERFLTDLRAGITTP